MTLVRAVVWALSWALGVALGVALGAYLTATSGVGAPGVQALDTSDLVRVPALAGGVVFVIALAARLLAAAWRSRRPQAPHDNER